MLSSVSWRNSTELCLHRFQAALTANAGRNLPAWQPFYGKVTLLVQGALGLVELPEFCLCGWGRFSVQLVGESKHLPSSMGCFMYLLHLWFSFVKVLLYGGHAWMDEGRLPWHSRFCWGWADGFLAQSWHRTHWVTWSSSAATSYRLTGKSPVMLTGQFSDLLGCLIS